MIPHLIDGKPVESPSVLENINPATGEVLAEVALGGEREVALAVAAAKEAFPKWAGLPARSAPHHAPPGRPDRAPRARAGRTGDRRHRPAHPPDLEAADPARQRELLFLFEVATRISSQTFPVDSTMLNYTLLQPVGVCGLISPWNVPLMTATWKVAPCLALGNTAVLKMSELSPMTADRLGRLALEAGVPKGVLNIVHGHGSEAGDALVRHPDVRTISFTGGTATGQRIAERAGIKRLSMELGGKSPVLVFEDADQQRALDAALFTIFSINGERCTAGSRVFVQRSIYDRFAREFAERAARLIVGDPRDPDTNVGSMITRQHWEKVTGYIEIGRREGAVVAAGGGVPAGLPARVAKGNFVQPTVLTGVDNRMRVAQEEIFGPVVCLIPSTTRTRACGWPTTAATGWLPTSGPRTWARPTGWRAASRPAWSSSTARTCATCASPSAASRTRAWAARAATPAWRPSAR